MRKTVFLSLVCSLIFGRANSQFVDKIANPVDYVNPLMGTSSTGGLSNGNTYPAIGLPWGMNTWMPQTGKIVMAGLTSIASISSEVLSKPTSLLPGSMTMVSLPSCR